MSQLEFVKSVLSLVVSVAEVGEFQCLKRCMGICKVRTCLMEHTTPRSCSTNEYESTLPLGDMLYEYSRRLILRTDYPWPKTAAAGWRTIERASEQGVGAAIGLTGFESDGCGVMTVARLHGACASTRQDWLSRPTPSASSRS